MSRRFSLALAIFILSTTALTGLWTWASWQVETVLTAWTETRRAEGWTVAYTPPDFSGWPMRLTADLREPALVSPRRLSWRGPTLNLESTLWAPLTVKVNAPGRHEFRWPALRAGGDGGQATLDAAEVEGTAHFSADGRLRRLDAQFREAAMWQAPDGRGDALQIAELGLKLGQGLSRDRAAPARIRLDAREIVLPGGTRPPLGREIARLAIEGDLSGELPDGPLSAALEIWRDSGGTVQLDSLDLVWGPLDLEGTGVLRLDEELRPVGKLRVTATGLGDAMKKLAEAGLVDSGAVFAARLAIEALGDREENTGRKRLTVPVSFRGGMLYLGPVALLPVPPLPLLLDPV